MVQEPVVGRTTFDIKEYLDPIPEGAEARKEFIAQWNAYFRGGLTDKIKNLIARQKDALAKFPLTEREADFYRAGINFGELLLEWGDDVISEYGGDHAAPQDAFNSEE